MIECKCNKPNCSFPKETLGSVLNDLFFLDRYDLMTNLTSNAETSWLKTGLYLLLHKPNVGLVIHWPEHGCYYDDTPSDSRKNMVNLHRYVCFLF
jgi:hypothetical protein